MKTPGPSQGPSERDPIKEAINRDPVAHLRASVDALAKSNQALSLEQLSELTESLRILRTECAPKTYEMAASLVATFIKDNFQIEIKVEKPEFDFMGKTMSIKISFPHEVPYSKTIQKKILDALKTKFPNIIFAPGYGLGAGTVNLDEVRNWGIIIPGMEKS